MKQNTLSISIVISVHNGGREFQDCLESLARHREQFSELIVVDDGSTDHSVKDARASGARIVRVDSRRGPAHGRNTGAKAATGDIVLFLDADVSVGAGTISRIRQRFDDDPDLGAVFGSYDDEPSAPGPVSQFRNLLHFHVHQTSNPRASTFWTGCGAIRRRVFLETGGFNIAYSTSCVEDLEFGMRLSRDGVRIGLDPSIQVKHLKCWTLRGMIITDIFSRGIPWTKLILETHRMPDDLNLRQSARASVALTGLICLETVILATRILGRGTHDLAWGPVLFLLAASACVAMLNVSFYRFLGARRQFGLAALAVPLHFLHFACCGTAFVVGAANHYWHGLGVSLSRIKPAVARQFEE